MAKINKESKKISNGLKPLINRLGGGSTRHGYADAVVEYLAKPENGSHTVTRNSVYLLVNDYVKLSPSNLFIAQAVKAVVENLEKEIAEFEAVKANFIV